MPEAYSTSANQCRLFRGSFAGKVINLGQIPNPHGFLISLLRILTGLSKSFQVVHVDPFSIPIASISRNLPFTVIAGFCFCALRIPQPCRLITVAGGILVGLQS